MLKKIEIGLTIVSILLGTYEILGRTNVVSGPTPIEAVQDAVGDGGGERSLAEPTPRPPEELEDLIVRVQRCEVFVDSVTVDVVAESTRPIRTGIDGLQVTATSGALTDASSLSFDNSTTSSSWPLSLTTGPGSHTITVVLDADDRYAEADETNNVAVVTAEVPADPLAATGTCAPV